ncbi:hypothetical protein CEXT_124011 [Caerostris extrusa]|uniref:Uncharacterized protein n=1 Tax=Caerostris extrusa TaxID=172846 RepID=A0AAV4RF18_CAEEX|nr:hypothetical protein CEXT_124011 [Caerostris extrusa]
MWNKMKITQMHPFSPNQNVAHQLKGRKYNSTIFTYQWSVIIPILGNVGHFIAVCNTRSEVFPAKRVAPPVVYVEAQRRVSSLTSLHVASL